VSAGTGGAAQGAAADFLLRFANVGHEAGYSTAELEERIISLAHSLGVEQIQVSVTPTVVEMSLGPLAHQHTYTLRVVPSPIRLGRISDLDDLVRDILDESLGSDVALERLDAIAARKRERPWWVVVGAYGLAGAALAPVIGGGWREAAAAAIVGLVVGVAGLAVARWPSAEPVAAPIAAIAASFSAAVLVHLGMSVSADVVTLAALVSLLPGMTLTVGVRELATQHLQSGVANTANALIQLVGLGFGVEIGRSVALSWLGNVHKVAPLPASHAVQVVAAVAAGAAFNVSLRARRKDVFIMCSATVLALVSNEVGSRLLGHKAGVFGAALVVGVAGGILGARLRRSPLVFLVPGVLMLVPGSAGFRSVLQLLTTNETVSGISAAVDTFVTAISIAYGLLIATVVLPRRLTEIRPSRPG
jgi:uncharacterized membrane protein YjjP (DUF1212 family)